MYDVRKNDRHQMSDALLEKFTEAYIQSQTQSQILFTWHGGEALMRPLSFYQRAVELQRKYGAGKQIDNCIQTNGTLLNEAWCKFFHDQGWLVGVSIDGPRSYHDEYRRNKQGMPSFQQVMRGIDLLNKYQVQWNALAVVNDYNAEDPLGFYHFFKSIQCHYIQFTPIVERLVQPSANSSANTDFHSEEAIHLASRLTTEPCELAPFSVTADQWGHFLCEIFDEWVKEDVGTYFVQLFDATLANWVGEQPGVCSMAATCGHAGVMEFNGDVFSCDHFVFPEYKLGNLHTDSLVDMMYGERQTAFGRQKSSTLPQQCRDCAYLFACYGECPKNRFETSVDGEPGLNYLCKGYYRFFKHVAPYMDYMKERLDHQEPPSMVMKYKPTSL